MEKVKDILCNKKIWTAVLILLILLELVLTIVYTNKYFIKFELDSDYANDSIYAKFLAETGDFLLSDDWYPTTEVYTIHHQLIMTPLFYIFDDYSLVYTITTAISFILISLTYYYFMKTFSKSTIKSLLTILLICNPINSRFIEMTIWFHGYMFYVILGVLYITILFKLIYQQVNKVEIISLMIISLFCGLCGVRMFLLSFVPLLMVLLWRMRNYQITINYKNIKNIKNLRNFISKYKKIILIIFAYVLAFLGYFIYNFILVPKFGYGHTYQATGISIENIATNIQDIILLFLNCFGFEVEGKNVFSLSFIKNGIILIFWIVVLAQNIKLAFNINKDTEKKIQLISLYSLFSTVITVIFMILTVSNDIFQSSNRYLVLANYLVIPIAIVGLKKPQFTIKNITLYFIIALAILSGFDSYFDYIKASESATNTREGYIEFLDNSDYTFGTATYWNAGITTFLSEKEIAIRPTSDTINLNIMFQWNTIKSYENMEPEFLLLTTSEYTERCEKIETEDLDIANNVVYEDACYVIIDLD